jgi:hypothetical protein
MIGFKKRTMAALLAAAGITLAAHAAAAIDLSEDERKKLHESITSLSVTTPPVEWTPEIDGTVPEEIHLLNIPASLQIVKVIRYRYTVHNDKVVLADPLTRKIVAVIGKE